MKLDKYLIKGALEEHLNKEGHTLQDLEEYFKTGVEKKADDKKDKKDSKKPIYTALPGFAGNLYSLGKIMGGVSGVVGGLGGIGAYGAYTQMKDSDKQIARSQETIRKIEAARRELEAIKAQQSMGYSGL